MRIHVKVTGVSNVVSGYKNFSYQCEVIDPTFTPSCQNIWLHPMDQLIFDPDDNISEYEGSEVVDVHLANNNLKEVFLKKLEERLKHDFSKVQLDSHALTYLANDIKQDLIKSAQVAESRIGIVVKVGILNQATNNGRGMLNEHVESADKMNGVRRKY